MPNVPWKAGMNDETFRHFIDARATPRVTAADPAETHPPALEETETGERRGRIARTGRVKTAPRARDQMERLGEEALIEPHQGQREPREQGGTRFAHAAGPDLAAVIRAAAAA